MLGLGDQQWRIDVVYLDPGSIGRNELPLAVGKAVRFLRQQPDGSGCLGRTPFQAKPQPVAGQDRNGRIIGRKDGVQPHSEPSGEERKIILNVLRRQADLGFDRWLPHPECASRRNRSPRQLPSAAADRHPPTGCPAERHEI